jgi:hypothetical protein
MFSKKELHTGHKALLKQQLPQTGIQNPENVAPQMRPANLIKRAKLDPDALTPRDVRQLQRTIGNRGVVSLLTQTMQNASARPAVQRKLPANIFATLVQRQKGLEEGAELERKAGPAVIQRQETEEAAPAVVVTDDDRAEFAHFRRGAGRADNTRFATVEDYVTYRDGHFGSRAEYDAIKAVADTEWDAHATIRNRVGQSTDSAERRKALYRWLRLEYRRAGIDTAPEIVALMRRGMTAELRAMVDRVRAAHPGLRTGGFVARPKKHTNIGYRLGTLSEHGTGRAFDITPQDDNPQIPSASWRFIERLVGRRVDRRRRRWETDPAALWQDVHDLNREYEEAVNRSVSEIRADREAAGVSPDHPDPRDEVLAGSRWLRRRAAARGLSFFTLSEDLVLALHGEGLVWGVTFPTPDLHHFELA